MARIERFYGPIKNLSGSISKESNLTFRTMYGRTYLVRKSRRNKPYNKAEIGRMQLFSEISKLASEMLNNPELRPKLESDYEKSGKKKVNLRAYVVSELYKRARQRLNEDKTTENDSGNKKPLIIIW